MGLIDFLLSSTETEASKSKRTRTVVLGSQAYHKEIGRNGETFKLRMFNGSVRDIVPMETKSMVHMVFQCYHRAEL